jgi:hypothetical protein
LGIGHLLRDGVAGPSSVGPLRVKQAADYCGRGGASRGRQIAEEPAHAGVRSQDGLSLISDGSETRMHAHDWMAVDFQAAEETQQLPLEPLAGAWALPPGDRGGSGDE